MKKIIPYLFLLLISCKTRHHATENKIIEKDWKALKYTSAEIYYPEGMDGCPYLVKLEDEKTLEPVNLPDSMKIPTVKIWIRYHIDRLKMSTCMMGEIIVVDDIQLRK